LTAAAAQAREDREAGNDPDRQDLMIGRITLHQKSI